MDAPAEKINIANRVTVYVWSSLVNGGKIVGHVSLRVRNEYISFWPIRDKSLSTSVFSPVDICFRTYEEDVSEEGREPDHTVHLYSLNASKIISSYKQFKKQRYESSKKSGWSLINNVALDAVLNSYDLETHNCATFALMLLNSGGLNESLVLKNFTFFTVILLKYLDMSAQSNEKPADETKSWFSTCLEFFKSPWSAFGREAVAKYIEEKTGIDKSIAGYILENLDLVAYSPDGFHMDVLCAKRMELEMYPHTKALDSFRKPEDLESFKKELSIQAKKTQDEREVRQIREFYIQCLFQSRNLNNGSEDDSWSAGFWHDSLEDDFSDTENDEKSSSNTI